MTKLFSAKPIHSPQLLNTIKQRYLIRESFYYINSIYHLYIIYITNIYMIHNRYNMNTTQTYNIDELITSISFGNGKSFKEQLLNDESFKILSGLYGKYILSRPHIEDKLAWLFQDFDKSYYDTALATVKVGGLMLDILHNGSVTIK